MPATDERPPAAIGHVRFNVTDIEGASRWLVTVGLRAIAYQAAILQYLSCAAALIWLSGKPSDHPSPGRERPSILCSTTSR